MIKYADAPTPFPAPRRRGAAGGRWARGRCTALATQWSLALAELPGAAASAHHPTAAIRLAVLSHHAAKQADTGLPAPPVHAPCRPGDVARRPLPARDRPPLLAGRTAGDTVRARAVARAPLERRRRRSTRTATRPLHLEYSNSARWLSPRVGSRSCRTAWSRATDVRTGGSYCRFDSYSCTKCCSLWATSRCARRCASCSPGVFLMDAIHAVSGLRQLAVCAA
mmetsp:Transcript_21873/g.70641  ORF Transcript_21873/g.70641 Transcript_21873/m.70641 type:complete len:224 (-) Transcript_21873:108-779(-)